MLSGRRTMCGCCLSLVQSTPSTSEATLGLVPRPHDRDSKRQHHNSRRMKPSLVYAGPILIQKSKMIRTPYHTAHVSQATTTTKAPTYQAVSGSPVNEVLSKMLQKSAFLPATLVLLAAMCAHTKQRVLSYSESLTITAPLLPMTPIIPTLAVVACPGQKKTRPTQHNY